MQGTDFAKIPIYAGVKGWPLLQPMLQQAQRQVSGSRTSGQQQQAGATGEAELSKRQAKMKAKQEKYSSIRVR